MSDESESNQPARRPMSDRSTVASKFETEASGMNPEDDAQAPLEPNSTPINANLPGGQEPRMGKDLSHEKFTQPSGKLDKLEGDSIFERLRPYVITLLLAVCIIGIVVYYTNGGAETEPTATDEKTQDYAQNPRPSITRSEAINNPAILIIEDNTVAMGGYERLKRLSSVAIRGVVNMDGKSIPFNLYGRRPNFYRLVYDISATDQYIVGFDGISAWEEYKRNGVSQKSSALSKEETANLITNADFDLAPQKYIFSAEYTVNDISSNMTATFITRELIDDIMYDVLKIRDGEKPAVICFIGASNNLLYKTIIREGGVSKSVIYSDYQKIDGVYVPFQREQFVDDKLVASITIENVEFNPGMLIGMFSQPKSKKP